MNDDGGVESMPASANADRAVRGPSGLLEMVGAEPTVGIAPLVAWVGLAATLVAGGFVLDPGVLPGGIRVLPWVVAVLTLVVAGVRRAGRWPISAEHVTWWAATVAAALAGAALGSRGFASAAAVGLLPLAWSSGVAGELAPGIAAPVVAGMAGIAAAGLLGVVRANDVVAAVAAVAVGAFAAWVGRGAAEEMVRAERQVVELRRIRTEMVTTVSHELRTPLTVIQGATATLSRRWDVLSEGERLDLVDVLAENVASLDASIMHFADAARLERGEVILAPQWVPVRDALSAAMNRRAAALAGHDVRLDLGVDSVWADPVALQRIAEHLLLNAARFSAVGLPINVRVTAGLGEATLTVADQGQGIAPRLLATVWEPLQRGDVGDTGVSRGAGLGLPIVRELARLHGGDATLSSVRGRGTTVSVTFPQPSDGDPRQSGPLGQPVRDSPAVESRRGALSRRSG